MRSILCMAAFLVVASLGLVACGTGTPNATPGTSGDHGADSVAVVGFTQEQVRDLAWQALDPNTSSHDAANWEVVDLRPVEGGQVAADFEGRPATPPAGATPLSPTAPPNVPEPFIYQAFFLIDPDDGRVVARRLLCVIY